MCAQFVLEKAAAIVIYQGYGIVVVSLSSWIYHKSELLGPCGASDWGWEPPLAHWWIPLDVPINTALSSGNPAHAHVSSPEVLKDWSVRCTSKLTISYSTLDSYNQHWRQEPLIFHVSYRLLIYSRLSLGCSVICHLYQTWSMSLKCSSFGLFHQSVKTRAKKIIYKNSATGMYRYITLHANNIAREVRYRIRNYPI